jgi:DNA-binding NtrC family response regulator
MPSHGRILIVDDEPALLRMLGVYLERLGYETEAASTTEEAWSKVENDPGRFVLAVLDATMPGLPMQELATRILAASPDICVVAASGYLVDTSALQDAAPGRVGFLHKPFTAEMLAEAVRRFLGPKENV